MLAAMAVMLMVSSAQGAAAAPGGADAGASSTRMDPAVRALVDRLQGFYEKTDDFQTRFRQEYRYKAFGRKQVSSGTILFKKPALMRWDYESPAAKTVLLTGDKVYLYDPAALTLTKASVSSDQLSAAVTFLMGRGKLAEEFHIAKAECAACKGTLLELTPKHPDTRFRKIQFEVDPATAQVVRSIVFDPTGDENEIRFEKLERNVGVAKERFTLKPPANVEVRDYSQHP